MNLLRPVTGARSCSDRSPRCPCAHRLPKLTRLIVVLVALVTLLPPRPHPVVLADSCEPYAWYAIRVQHSGSWDLRLMRTDERDAAGQGKQIGKYRTEAQALDDVCRRLFATNKFFPGAAHAVFEGEWHDVSDFIVAKGKTHECVKPHPDADADGKRDDEDRCPGTPANVPVQWNGCPCAEAPKPAAAKVNVTLRYIQTPLIAQVEAKYADGRPAANQPIIFMLDPGGKDGDNTETYGSLSLRWVLAPTPPNKTRSIPEVPLGAFEVSKIADAAAAAQATSRASFRFATDANGRAQIPLYAFPVGVPWSGVIYQVRPDRVSNWLRQDRVLAGYMEAIVYEKGTENNPVVLGRAKEMLTIDRVATLSSVNPVDLRGWDRRVEMVTRSGEVDVRGATAVDSRPGRPLYTAPWGLDGGETIRLDEQDQVVVTWIFPQVMAIGVKPGFGTRELTVMPEDLGTYQYILETINSAGVEMVGLVATAAGVVISYFSLAGGAGAAALGPWGLGVGVLSLAVGGVISLSNRVFNPFGITMRSQVVVDTDGEPAVYTLEGKATIHTADGRTTEVVAGKRATVGPRSVVGPATAFRSGDLSARTLALAATLNPAAAKSAPAAATAIPAASPRAPAGGALYRDDFANPKSGWPVGSSQTKETSYAGGEYVMRAIGAKKPVYAWLDRSFPRDVVVEVDARADGLHGLAIRGAGKDFLVFAVTDDGRYVVSQYLGGKWKHLLPNQVDWSEHIKTGGALNRLRIAAAGSDVRLYANGQLLTTVKDAAPVAGRIGLYVESYEGSPDATAHFDNLVVTGG